MHKVKSTKSFSLIEVLIVTSILSVFFVVAISVLVVALRNMKINEHKIYATHYARQLEDWLQTQKEIDWVAFTGKSGNFCFSSLSLCWPGDVGCTNTNAACLTFTGLNPNIYKRDLSLSATCAGDFCKEVNATITVAWQELGKDYSVQTKTVFSILE